MVDAALGRHAAFDCRPERRQRQAGIDTSADGIADHAARPGIENGRQIDEAGRDGDVGDVGDPELVGSCQHNVFRQVGEDRPVMVAVGGDHKTPARTHA
jgi:hypothetical protein